MKNFKLSILTLLTVFVTGLVFVSCETGEDSVAEIETEQLVSKEITSYLNEKVSNYKISDVNNSVNEYFFANVKGNNSQGYLVTDKNQQNIVAFINFDLTNNTTIIYDYVKNEEVFINNLDMYLNTNFDTFIDNVIVSNNDTSRRFWGWECGPRTTGDCTRVCTYYVLGQSVSGGTYDCDDVPGNNPKYVN